MAREAAFEEDLRAHVEAESFDDLSDEEALRRGAGAGTDANSGAAQVSPIDEGVLSETQLTDLWTRWEAEALPSETDANETVMGEPLARADQRPAAGPYATVLLTSPSDERPRERNPSVPHLTMPAWCAQEPREPPDHTADTGISGPALMSPLPDDTPSGTRILVYSRSNRKWCTARYVRRNCLNCRVKHNN